MKKSILSRTASILRGFLIYKRLNRSHGKQCHYYICPFKGTGDIYLIGLLFNEVRKNHPSGKSIFTVVNTASIKILKMYQIYDIEVLSQKESDDLVLFVEMLKKSLPNVTLCIDSIPWINHASIIWKLRGLNDCNFMDMFQRTVFKLDSPAAICQPKFSEDQFFIKSLLEISGVSIGRSIIIAPYSNSFPSLKMEKWEQICVELKNKGYKLFTNCAGNEMAIRGTSPISIPFECMKPILEAAGNFLAMRSGLCDIVSSARCRQVVLYPNQKWSQGTLFDYFSLKNMGLSESVKEIISNGKTEIIKQVTDQFPDISKARKVQL